jgi:hypothetical protein
VLAVVEAIVQRRLHVEALARPAYVSEHNDWQVGSGFSRITIKGVEGEERAFDCTIG